MSQHYPALSCTLDHQVLATEYQSKIGDGQGRCPDCDTRLPVRPSGCTCQAHGKSGVPYRSGKCMVCGEPVNWAGRLAL
jgi:hypothetical protein